MTNSFIFYASFYEALSEVEDDATQLAVYQAIAEYALTEKLPKLKGTASALFKLIKPQIDANIRRRENAKVKTKDEQDASEMQARDERDGSETRARRQRDASEPAARHEQDASETQARRERAGSETAANVNVNDNVNENVNVNAKKIYSDVISLLNAQSGSCFSPSSPATRRLIAARVNEGYTLSDFEKVIAKKSSEWRGTEFEKFLRPQTLFGAKFESYLNQREPRAKPRASGYEREYAEGELEGLVENAIDAILEHWEGEEKKGGVPIGEQGH